MKNGFILMLVLFFVVGCNQATQEKLESVDTISEKTIGDMEEINAISEPSQPTIIPEKEEKETTITTPNTKQEPIVEEETILTEPIQTKFYNDTQWMRIEMQDVITNKTFTLDSLQGEKIVVESFSEYCYNCGEQRVKLQSFIANNNSLRRISVNTDSNAKKEEVVESASRDEYGWTFVLASKEFRDSIIKQFGKDVVKYDKVPLVLICEDLSAYLLDDGLKGEFQLNEALKKCS